MVSRSARRALLCLALLTGLCLTGTAAQANEGALRPESAPELWARATRLMYALGAVDYIAQTCRATPADQAVPKLVAGVLEHWSTTDRQRLRLARMNGHAEQRGKYGLHCPGTGVDIWGDFIEAQAGFLEISQSATAH